jgi:cytochrome c5
MKSIPLSLTLAATVFLLAACGNSEAPAADAAAPAATEAPAAEAPATTEAAPAEAPAAEVASAEDVGKKVYGATCALCHASGVAGAPIPGDKEDWGPRIAQGMDVVYQHSIEGYNGSKGAMPARGGNPSLSDDDMKAAVDFMANQSK